MAVGDSAFHNKRNFGISSGRSRKKSKILFPQFEWGKIATMSHLELCKEKAEKEKLNLLVFHISLQMTALESYYGDILDQQSRHSS